MLSLENFVDLYNLQCIVPSLPEWYKQYSGTIVLFT